MIGCINPYFTSGLLKLYENIICQLLAFEVETELQIPTYQSSVVLSSCYVKEFL